MSFQVEVFNQMSLFYMSVHLRIDIVLLKMKKSKTFWCRHEKSRNQRKRAKDQYE